MSSRHSHFFSATAFLLGIFFACGVSNAATSSLTAGQSCVLSVTAEGSAPFSHQWFHDGKAITGSTDSTYSIGSVTAADAGTYYARVTNSAGFTNSDTVTVAYVAPPVFTVQPSGGTVNVGGSVMLSASANGSPAPTYQWRKNGTAISGATSSSYSLATLSAADAGTYTVVATNSAGSVTSTGAVLTVSAVTIAPSITTQPAGQTVTLGASVTFTVAASGSPAPTYQWRKNGTNISGATGSSYSLATVASGDAATYSVVATNSAGKATSNGALLTVSAVNFAPVFVVQPISRAVKKTGTVTFVAQATGTPSPTYQWRRNGASIKGATGATYTISNLSTTKSGTYTVVATNSKGSATSDGAVLTVTSTDAALAPVDFDGDGQTDILWQNIATGDLAFWRMSGMTKSSFTSLGAASRDWKISGAADFNGDGSTDILCQNTITGEWSIWLMSGSSIASKVSLGKQPLNSQISGIGDFNGDHRPDIVVQDSVTGDIAVWLMAGTARSAVVSLGNPGKGVEVSGSGDFSGDGMSDLVLQNSATGQTYVWLLSGTKVTWKAWVVNQPIEWQISGTGDFNADGKSDLLWQNVLTGECEVWLMSVNTVKDTVSLGTESVDWVIRN